MAGINLNFDINKDFIMALNKPTPTPKPSFEDGSGENMGGEETVKQSPAERLKAEAASRAAAAPKEEETAKPASTERAVAPQAPNAGQVAVTTPMVNPFTPLKNAFHVEFDTLLNVQLNQGNAINKDTNAALGDVIGLELLSFQDQTVVSPGVDGAAAKEHVRYSDDGVNTSKGENVTQYLADLKASGFEKANLSRRVVIVGSLFDPGSKGSKIDGMKDKLVQINLPPSSVSGFNRYQADQAFKIARGLAAVEGSTRMKITCSIKTKGDNTWTVADFSRYDE